MGKHSRGTPRETPPELRVTRPQPVYKALKRHKKKASWLKKSVRVIVALLVILILMSVIGNFLPAKKVNSGAPPPTGAVKIVNVADVLRNDSPYWTVAQHIVAVVRPDDGGKSILLVNAGKGTASAVIPLWKLGITPPVTLYNVWAGTTGKPVSGIRVVIPQGSAVYLIAK